MLTVNKRGLTRIVKPAIEPLNLAETKLYLRVDGSAEDALIADLINAAREFAEQYMKRSMLTQTWLLTLADYAPETIELPMGPVQSIVEIRLVNVDDEETIYPSTQYSLNQASNTLSFKAVPYSSIIEIEYVAGIANAADLPKSIKYGMLSHIASMYDMRGEVTIAPSSDTLALYAPYREVRI